DAPNMTQNAIPAIRRAISGVRKIVANQTFVAFAVLSGKAIIGVNWRSTTTWTWGFWRDSLTASYKFQDWLLSGSEGGLPLTHYIDILNRNYGKTQKFMTGWL